MSPENLKISMYANCHNYIDALLTYDLMSWPWPNWGSVVPHYTIHR